MSQAELFVLSPSTTESADAIALRYGEDLSDRETTRVVVVDGGRNDSSGAQLQEIVTQNFQTDRIDLVVTTHSDADHAGGVPYLLDNLNVDELWIHCPHEHRPDREPTNVSASADNVARVLETAARRGVPLKEPFAELEHGFEGLHILGPSQAYFEELMAQGMYTEDELDHMDGTLENEPVLASGQSGRLYPLLKNPSTRPRNNSSTILLLRIDSFQLLLTADAGVAAFESARARFEECGYDPKRAIVQLPHHGSRNNLNPETASLLLGSSADETRTFATAAVDDRYGFPHQEVIDEFIERGRRIPKPGTTVWFGYGLQSIPANYGDDVDYIKASWDNA